MPATIAVVNGEHCCQLTEIKCWPNRAWMWTGVVNIIFAFSGGPDGCLLLLDLGCKFNCRHGHCQRPLAAATYCQRQPLTVSVGLHHSPTAAGGAGMELQQVPSPAEKVIATANRYHSTETFSFRYPTQRSQFVLLDSGCSGQGLVEPRASATAAKAASKIESIMAAN